MACRSYSARSEEWEPPAQPCRSCLRWARREFWNLFGGSLLILGLLTRPAAAVLVAEMIVAYFLVHAPQGGWPIQNQGELALLYAAIFVFLAGNGAGPFSLDAWMPVLNAYDRRHGSDRRDRMAAWSDASLFATLGQSALG